MKKRASASSVYEARRQVSPPKEWYSRITAEMVEEYWPLAYIPSYFADVLNGSTPLDEARDDLLSFVPGYREREDSAPVDESGAGLPVVDLGRVLRLDGCGKQKNMCWGSDGFVLAHKDVNPDFDGEKPFIVVIDHDGAWQMHFENFGTMPKNEKILDDMYKAVAASCKKGMELELRGGATPGGLSGFSKLRDYGFRKEPLSDDTPVYWGGELDPARLEKWLNSGRHDDDFLVRTDGDVEPGVEGGVFVSPREYSGKITAGNTKPRPFKMVKAGGKKTISEQDSRVLYWAHMLDECGV